MAKYKNQGEIITQGIKYAGSKLAIVKHILSAISDLQVNTVLDGFSGTTRVSQALAQSGYEVTCSDISAWSDELITEFSKKFTTDMDYIHNEIEKFRKNTAILCLEIEHMTGKLVNEA